MFDQCTCGEAHPHEVMRRHTADGIYIHLESDGKVLGLMGRSLAGVPVRRPKTAASHREALKTGRLFMQAVGFYDAAELGQLYADAREACRRGVEIREVQHKRRIADSPNPALSWVTIRADRNGKPTERHARLPRLLWPDLAVADYCGGPGSKRGRYVLLRRDANDGHEVWREVNAFSRMDALWGFVRGAGVSQ